MMKPRLYLRLYLAFLGIAALSLLVTAVLAGAFHQSGGPTASYLAPLANSLDCTKLPCQGETAGYLTETSRRLNIDIAIWDQEHRELFQSGRVQLLPPRWLTPGWHHSPHGPIWLSPLGDGRMLGIHERGHFRARGHLFLPLLVVILVVMAVGLYPLSRSITRRVEHLTLGARRWGEGDLAHRVPVEGKDEIASLAEHFNQAASAIEALLTHERQMLATASHELRSPLARIRVGLELLNEEADPIKRSEIIHRSCEDITELDSLVEELLLAARTQAGVPRRPFVEVDVFALVSAEAETVVVEVQGEPLFFACEISMFKRMVRNLFVNARLHGQGGAIRAEVRRGEKEILIAVEDEGPGVPEAERERIFAPFYRPPGPRPPGDTGLGLGLALVRQIARYHHGDVVYLPRQPKGSRFEVRLPVAM
jgi:two-component system OmpR family sensor kinase